MLKIDRDAYLIKVIPVFFIWFIYHAIYLALVSKELTAWAGYFPLIAQVGLDIAVVCFSFFLHKKIDCPKQKNIHLLFFLSALSAMTADFIYHFGMNIINVNYFNKANSFFEIPFILFLFFQAFAWKQIFFMDTEKIQGRQHYLPYITLATLIFFVFVCIFPWKISYFSKLGIYQLIDTFLEGIGFVLAALCLARSQKNPVRFLSIGYLLIISSDLLIRHDVISGLIPSFSPFETTWSLGLLLICVGFYNTKTHRIALLPLNSLQSHIAIWLLNFLLLVAFLFICLNYFFPQKEILYHLLSFTIPGTLFAIICSKYFASRILDPHKRLELIIKNFLAEGEEKYLDEINRTSTKINDFVILEKFIYDAFDIYKKNHKIEIEYAKMATQVAHDIQSPLHALNNYFKEAIQPNPSTSPIIESSIGRINEIANNLLLQHKKTEELSTTIEPELIKHFLEELIVEKKMQFKHQAIQIDLSIQDCLHDCYVTLNTENFKRTISNLINNAAEAVTDNPLIQISLYKELNTLILTIKDHGSGMPDDVLSSIKKGYTNSCFKGNGLGLPFALKNIKEWNAEYQISSRKNEGTEFKILFRIQPVPDWVQKEIFIYNDLHIVIVDDDYSQEAIWKNILFNINKNIKVTYIQNPYKLIFHHQEMDLNNTFFFIDYHFANFDMSGMELIKKLAIKNAIMVSSKYPNKEIKIFLKNNEIHFLLKKNIPDIKITNITNNPHLILIDDNQLTIDIWELEAQKVNKHILAFRHGYTFMKYAHLLDKEIPVYLDFLLENEDSEEVSKNLYELGFMNIYITTGFDSRKIKRFSWIKDIFDKSPPFKSEKSIHL